MKTVVLEHDCATPGMPRSNCPSDKGFDSQSSRCLHQCVHGVCGEPEVWLALVAEDILHDPDELCFLEKGLVPVSLAPAYLSLRTASLWEWGQYRRDPPKLSKSLCNTQALTPKQPVHRTGQSFGPELAGAFLGVRLCHGCHCTVHGTALRQPLCLPTMAVRETLSRSL